MSSLLVVVVMELAPVTTLIEPRSKFAPEISLKIMPLPVRNPAIRDRFWTGFFAAHELPSRLFCTCGIVEKWECAFVRTTIELPDPLFREVKATAARQGMRLKDYITEALQDKLTKRPNPAEKPWMKFAGIAANDPEMVAELRRIEQIVDENFEQIEEQEWK